MTDIGFALSSELYGPTELVDQAVRAEEAGFDFVAISDHFHPWIAEQGHSPYAWTALGGIARATEDIQIGTGVTCPTFRLRPVNVAHAAATTAAMSDGRFFLGLGSGELLNEHVVAERWPPHDVRMEKLEEAVAVMRKLWTGEEVTHRGEHFTVEDAKLFTLPEEDPPIYLSAYGDDAATTAGPIADGFYTVGPLGDVLETYRDAGGDGPAFGQLSTCYEETQDEAISAAYERWPNTGLTGELSSQLRNPAQFEQACEMVSEEDIAEGSMVTDPDPTTHVENVETFEDAGFDHVVIHQVGTDLDGFFDTYENDVLPEFQ